MTRTTQNRKQEERAALDSKLAQMLEPEPEQAGKPFYEDFASYVKDYPDAERYRGYLTGKGAAFAGMLLLRRERNSHHNTFPGHYLGVSVSKNTFGTDRNGQPKQWVQLTVFDNDDGFLIRRWDGLDDAPARQVLAEMKEMSPFTKKDAVDYFGLSYS